MTDATDALVGTVGGLLAVGIMANVAGRMIDNNRRQRPAPIKPRIIKVKPHHHKHKKPSSSLWY